MFQAPSTRETLYSKHQHHGGIPGRWELGISLKLGVWELELSLRRNVHGARVNNFRHLALVVHADGVIVVAGAQDHRLLVAQAEEGVAVVAPILLPHRDEPVGNGRAHIVEGRTSDSPWDLFQQRGDLRQMAGYLGKRRVG